MRRRPVRLHVWMLASFLLSSASGVGAEQVSLGDSAWAARAVGEREGRAQPGPILEAAGHYERALAADRESLQARWKLLRALHFAGDFTSLGGEDARASFERARIVSEEGSALLASRLAGGSEFASLSPAAMRAAIDGAGIAPENVARFYFWSAITWGAWSRSAGLMGAVRQGVAKRLHDYARITIALEPGYEEGGAYRLLSRMHAELPRVPFLTGWVDRDRALPLIERAYTLSPEHPGNRLLMAVTLLERYPNRRAEAVALLESVCESEARPTMRVEELAIRKQAVERVAALGTTSDA